MVYSCAYWPDQLDDDLGTAQVAKLDWHATAVHVDGTARVLDVGCGWGAMMAYLTGDRGVGQVTGLTLSADQASYIADRQPDADIRLEDWRDHQPLRPYDAIISIGAFEHFARPELSTTQRRAVYTGFFERCAGWLPTQGRLSLQTIGYEDFDRTSGPVSSFFTDEVFPESTLPHLSDIVVAVEPSFRILALRSDGHHYSQTLRLWQGRLEAQKGGGHRACRPGYLPALHPLPAGIESDVRQAGVHPLPGSARTPPRVPGGRLSDRPGPKWPRIRAFWAAKFLVVEHAVVVERRPLRQEIHGILSTRRGRRPCRGQHGRCQGSRRPARWRSPSWGRGSAAAGARR